LALGRFPSAPPLQNPLGGGTEAAGDGVRSGPHRAPRASWQRPGVRIWSSLGPIPPVYRPLTAHDWHQPCYHSCGILPVHAVVHAGVFELAIHGWDIRSTLEPPAHLSPDALTVLPDYFAACLHWFFLPGARLPTPIRYRFAFTGRLNSTWDMVIEGDQAHMGPAVDATSANATFRGDGAAFALMMGGRMGFDATLGNKRMIPTGDMAVAQAFKQWFQGV